jgi:chromosome segregation ATPase
MRRLVVGICVVAIGGLFQSALAQGHHERCEQKKSEIAGLESQITSIDNEMNAMQAKIMKVQNRLNDLRNKQQQKGMEKANLQKQLRQEQLVLERVCRELRQCEANEHKIEALKTRMGPVALKLQELAREIQTQSAEATRLNQEVDKIEASYQQLNCDNLVPGQTAQATIDRCSDLFSQWNQMQREINAHQTAVNGMRNRYQSLMAQMRGYNLELDQLLRFMRENCQQSPRLVEVETMDKERNEFNLLKGQLDGMDNSVKKFRALKILQPKLKIQPKPGLKPVK